MTNLRGKLTVLAVVVVAITGIGNRAETTESPLAIHEAEILIYLIPQCRSARAGGAEIVWELTSTNDTQYDFYVAVARTEYPVTIGHFQVNRKTADVVFLGTMEPVVDKELAGVQEILRRAHGMSTR